MYRFRERKFVKLAWVGWSDYFLEDLDPNDANEIRNLYVANDCYPVFVPRETLSSFSFYIQTILQPIFHSFKDLHDCK